MEQAKSNAPKKDVLSYVLISFFAVFNICFYTPFDVFITNASDAAFPMKPLLLFLGVLTLAVFAVLLLAALLTRGKANRILCAVVFAISAGLYIQGNFLAINMGELDGGSYDLPAWKAVLNVVIWLVILAAPFVVLKKYKGNVINLFSHISAAIILIQLIALSASVCMSIGELDGTTFSVLFHGDSRAYCTTDDLDLYSSTKNFIILLADEYDSEIYDNAVETAPDSVSEFDGFTYYQNTVGKYPATHEALEHITAGSFSPDDFENYSNQTLFQKLGENYISNWYSDPEIPPTVITSQYTTNNKFKKINLADTSGYARFLFKLTMFRCAPEVMKPLFVTNGMNLALSVNNFSGETLFDLDNLNFYNNMPETFRFTDKPVFKYIHIMGCHLPLNVTADMQRTVDGSIEDMGIASNKVANKYFKILKDNGVYDNSTIFFMADHGHYDLRQYPLFMCKPENSTETGIKVSNAPISYDDMYPTFLKLAGGEPEERTIFDIGENESRERIFFGMGGEEHIVSE